MVTIGLDYTSEAGWQISGCVLDMGDVLSGGSKGVGIASICIRTGLFRSLRAEIDDERSMAVFHLHAKEWIRLPPNYFVYRGPQAWRPPGVKSSTIPILRQQTPSIHMNPFNINRTP